MRDFLRSLPVFAAELPRFDPGSVPETPDELFVEWLRGAVEAGQPEPHAMTLSTVDAAGSPDARVLILKDLDAVGWWFATSALSAKGVQLAARPSAALTFYWPAVGRQVRVRGPVVAGSREQAVADFLARGVAARRSADDPGLVDPDWRVYAVAAQSVEFWQADQDRLHTRVLYRRESGEWHHSPRWP